MTVTCLHITLSRVTAGLNPFSPAPEQCSGTTECYSLPAPEHCSCGETGFFNPVLRSKSMHTQWVKGSYRVLLPSRPRYVVFTVQFKENCQFFCNFVEHNEQTSAEHRQASSQRSVCWWRQRLWSRRRGYSCKSKWEMCPKPGRMSALTRVLKMTHF